MIMDKFSQILQRLPTSGVSTSKNHFGGSTAFKVQVKFGIPIFWGKIDVDVIDEWLNLLEGYFFVHDFSSQEILLLLFSKHPPHQGLVGNLL